MLNGCRIAVTGEGEDERFTVLVFPETPERPGHFMNTVGPMTESEFRADLTARGIAEALIDETIAGARAHPRS